MLKPLLACVLTACFAATSFAAVDANTATEAELDGIRGIGPGLSGRILAERQSAPFKDWADFIARVPGVGKASAGKLSAGGLTVNHHTFSAAKAHNQQSPASASSASKN